MNFIFTPSNEYFIETPLEVCVDGSKLKTKYECSHAKNTECKNNSTFHHSNIVNVMNTVENASQNYAVMLITPNLLCKVNTDSTHGTLNGVCWQGKKELIAGDIDYRLNDETSTIYGAGVMAHEIGHLYGITDHYYDENVNCIWGKNREEENIYTKMVVCSNCLKTLRENVGKYNHTPLN